MKRTTIWTAGTLLSLLPVLASVSFAGSQTSIRLGAAVFTQAPSKKPTISRRDVDRMLAQARSAIRNRRFDEAERLIAQAERSGISYSIFHPGDSPKKVRRELARARSLAVSQQLPEQANPFEEDADDRPGAGSVEMNIVTPAVPALDHPGPDPSGMIRSPEAVEASDRLSVPALQRATVGTENARLASDTRIRAARLALAVGDTRRAQALVAQAKQYQVHYQLADDSPAKVEAAIAKYQQVLENQAALKKSPEWRRHYAKVLYEQAEALLHWGELDEAERLALDAAQFGGTAGPGGAPESDLLQRIAAARRAKTAASSVPAPPRATLQLTTPPVPAGDSVAMLGAQEPPLVDHPVPPPGAGAGGSEFTGAAKQESLSLLAEAREALRRGDIPRAEELAMEASSLNVPETAFASGEDRPSSVALAVHAAQMREASSPSGGAGEASAGEQPLAAKQTLYEPQNDLTRDILADGDDRSAGVELAQNAPDPLSSPPDAAPVGVRHRDADELLSAGEEALRNQNLPTALEHFRQAYEVREQLDPLSQQRLQERLQMLSGAAPAGPTPSAPSLIDATTDREKLLIRQISADLTKKQTAARQLRESDPQKALASLKEARRMVETASINEAARTQLLRRVDTSIGETEAYIEQNRAQLELDAKNQSIQREINRDRAIKVQVQEKIAQLVDQFNQLRDEQRYAEAEVVGRRLYELAPDEPVVKQVWREAKIIRRERLNQIVKDEKESANYVAMLRNEQASAMMDPDNPIDYGDAHVWDQLTQRRQESARKRQRHRSERELEIERRLKMPVQLQYTDRPLAEVIDGLAELSGINVHLDPLGMDQEGIRSDTPVTINLRNEISLESALNLILEPLHLSYVIKNEVLKITSEALRDDEVYQKTYDVADLVIPIPNFAPSANMGLQGLINEAHASLGYGGFGGYGGLGMPGPTATVVNNRRHPLQKGGDLDQNVLAQQMTGLPGVAPPPTVPIGGGPGGMGGGTQADFDALIELIVSTVHPDSWDENGGPGSLREFETNLSLVVSQTQEVHEQIADLLDQLRRLQDLQVTIEVRFITLSDQFFERIGVDFDFNIEDGPGVIDPRPTAGQAVEPSHPSSTVGLLPPPDISLFPNFTADLDLPYRSESFTLSVAPTFASPVDVASFGFAILSDLEAYFLINAAQGDRRSNILEAPKVTLFNGQLALVTDTVQRPFVISVIPVVGDFAAAQQPVIVVLSEGTFLSIQAVVTEDRRYVRLTVVPFFSQIGDVETFTFEGTTTSSSSSSSRDDDENNTVESAEDSTEVRSGTTVQQPTFEIVAVSTTVSVPDGGTVLLGGVKRLSEGRNEFGVPLLSKVPYINRLFRNVGIGRSTQSLMMMVTPRIIIQEEEEERLGVTAE